MLNVGFAARLLIGFALLLSQAGLFASLCLAADAIGFFLCFAAFRFNSGLLFALRTLSCFALFTFRSLFGQNRFALSGGCGVNFTLRLFCCLTFRFLFCTALNLFFAGNALALGFCFFSACSRSKTSFISRAISWSDSIRAASCRSNSSFMTSAST